MMDEMKDEGRRAEAERMVRDYLSMLMERGRKIKATGYRSCEDMEHLLIGVCREAVREMDLEGEGADVGSGNGSFIIALKLLYPDKKVYCIERNRRKAAFIRYVMHRLNIEGVEVIMADMGELRGKYKWDWVVLREVLLDKRMIRDIESCLKEEGRIYWITSPAKAVQLRRTGLREVSLEKSLAEGYVLIRV